MAIRNLCKGLLVTVLLLGTMLTGCKNSEVANLSNSEQTNIIFLHHSTGQAIWEGQLSKYGRFSRFAKIIGTDVEKWFKNYNIQNGTNYHITETIFPKESPYGWNNYPYDYYNIWVKNAGDQPYKNEPTLEILTKQYDVIIFKHCFPVSAIQAGSSAPDINSSDKTLGNYKLQYEALKKKLYEFPETKFILWTPPALVEKATTEEEAKRAAEFTDWVINVWDTPNDNIYLWDFRSLEVEGELYMEKSYAASETDSHPNSSFSKTVAPYFCQRIIEVIAGNGDNTNLVGKR